ncbi:putative competence-damage inducible protein [Rubripirellula obstinata]|uniref:Putative competence-damage inducible protein n=1 Tax=Rubripirellula obstinata TaxID=406547 RepID=A0A5B1CRL6_9BACT|nr:molybdopterin-binding protein [Rubripirellula obstinata]KAA1262023.1 putative competence-damage inducible protein [Rubripirellula obstinata]
MSDQVPACLTAEVVSIGDEMTSGARLDTNAQWLSRRLGELGLQVKFHSTVGDTLADNVDVFRIAASRANVVVSTGGLGPTRDDLTREALAAAIDRPLVQFDSALQHIESMFASRGRQMPARNHMQAMFPEGSQEIFNPQGTAPGVDLKFDSGGRVFALPGVPAEMKRMFDETVSPRILKDATAVGSAGGSHIRHDVMKFFGTGESDMEERLGQMIDRKRSPRVGITVSKATISLRITATGNSESDCAAQIAETRAEILERVSEFYFGDGETYDQQHAIDQQLRIAGQSLSIIELGRAAPLGDWFAAIEPTTSYRGGLSMSAATDLMAMLETDSIEASMATIAKKFASDWVILVDEYPSLDPSADQPIPASDVSIFVYDPAGNLHQKTVKIGGHPSIIQPRIAKTAMQFLRQQLQ